VAGYRFPSGVVVSPALGLVGLNEALHDDAGEFRPDRFLAGNPAPNTWIPFGGDPRRCIGAGFFFVESVEISANCCVPTSRSEASPERLRPRGIINAPSHGSRIRVRARAS